MNRVRLLLLMFAGFSTGAVLAGEPDGLFVERLRLAGFADVALEYLDRLGGAGRSELADRRSLERAKCFAALADAEVESRCRDRRMDAAHEAFEQWIASAADEASKVDARAELARLCIRRAQSDLARRPVAKSARQEANARCTEHLNLARSLAKAVRAARVAVQGSSPDGLRQRREADFDIALASFYLAQAVNVGGREGLQRRNQHVESARKEFEQLARADDAIAWQALAWVGKCWLELDNPGEARRVFAQVEHEGTQPAAAGGLRLAKYGQLLLLDRGAGVRSRPADVIRGATEWLDRFRYDVNTSEGRGVRYLLAKNLVARSGVTGQTHGVRLDAAGRESIQRAVDLLGELAAGGAEHSQSAAALRLDVAEFLVPEDVGLPMSFAEGYLIAQVELNRRAKLAPGPAGGARTMHVSRARAALEHGLALANSNDRRRDLFDARVLLCYCHLLDGNPSAAAVLGEYLARNSRESGFGARPAIYALSAYSAMIADGVAADAPANRRRITELAAFMEQRWPDEPETDAARFQLGELAFFDRNYAEAVRQYAKVRPVFEGFTYAKYREGAAAQLAASAGAGALPLLQTAIADLKRVPNWPAGASPEMVVAHAQVRLQLGELLLVSKGENAAAQASEIGRQLTTAMPGSLPDGEPARRQLEADAGRIWAVAATVEAGFKLNSGQSAQARSTLSPLVTHLRSLAGGQSQERRLLDAAMEALATDARAAVRLRHPPVGRDYVELFRGLGGDTSAFVARLAFELRGEDKENPAVAIALDSLAELPDSKPGTRKLIADGLSGIGRHVKAAELLAAIAPPTSEEGEASRTFHAARLALAREYRLGKAFDRAKSVMREILGTPTNKGWGHDNLDVRREALALCEDEGNFAGAVQIAVQVQKALTESLRDYETKAARLIHLRGDNAANNDVPGALRGIALAECDQLESDLRRLLPARDCYFEFWRAEMSLLLRYAQTLPPIQSAEALDRVAARLVKLERGHPDIGGTVNRRALNQLLVGHPALKHAYESSGGKALLNP